MIVFFMFLCGAFMGSFVTYRYIKFQRKKSPREYIKLYCVECELRKKGIRIESLNPRCREHLYINENKEVACSALCFNDKCEFNKKRI